MDYKRMVLFGLLIGSTLIGQSQIRIGNYKMNEMQNWDFGNQANARQVEAAKAILPSAQENLLDVDILMNVKASAFSAVFNIRQVGETAIAVNEIMEKRLADFKNALKEVGIDQGAIITDLISQTPIFGIEKERKLFTKTLNEVPLGFELEKNLIIPYANFQDLEKIVEIAARNEIYELVKVDYFTADPSVYYDSMRMRGVDYAKNVIKQIAPLGIRLDTLQVNWSEQTSTIYPITRYQRYNPLSKPGYSALLANRGSTTLETIPSPSLYYNHLAFNSFEVVIHPEVTEPVVQYVLNMKVRYSYPPQPMKVIYVMGADGRLQPLDIR